MKDASPRFVSPSLDLDSPLDPDATSIYDLRIPPPSPYAEHDPAAVLRQRIRETRRTVNGLREAYAAGWDIGPELAYEEQVLARLEG